MKIKSDLVSVLQIRRGKRYKRRGNRDNLGIIDHISP